ncbi:MAG: hypothetical protein HYU99_07445 [Deltaproteobacteria bacterium]|nr:hypothetical protein [Deltaproteobacteria bacterium]
MTDKFYISVGRKTAEYLDNLDDGHHDLNPDTVDIADQNAAFETGAFRTTGAKAVVNGKDRYICTVDPADPNYTGFKDGFIADYGPHRAGYENQAGSAEIINLLSAMENPDVLSLVIPVETVDLPALQQIFSDPGVLTVGDPYAGTTLTKVTVIFDKANLTDARRGELKKFLGEVGKSASEGKETWNNPAWLNLIGVAAEEVGEGEAGGALAQKINDCNQRTDNLPECLDEALPSPPLPPLTLEEAKKDVRKYLMEFAADLPKADTKIYVQVHQREIDAYVASREKLLKTDAEKAELQKFYEIESKAVLKWERRVEAEQTSALFLAVEAPLAFLGLPVLPGGHILPRNAAHFVPPDQLSKKEFYPRWWFLNVARIFYAAPPLTYWWDNLMESGQNGDTTSKGGAMGELVFSLADDISREKNASTAGMQLLELRGQKLPPWAQLVQGGIDLFAGYGDGYKSLYYATKKAGVIEQISQLPDAIDVSQAEAEWYVANDHCSDLTCSDWDGYFMSSEDHDQAVEDYLEKYGTRTDEFVEFDLSAEKAAIAMQVRPRMANEQLGFVSDRIANQGPLFGLVAGLVTSVGLPVLHLGNELDRPWAINPFPKDVADYENLVPPNYTEEDFKTDQRNALFLEGGLRLLGTGEAFIAPEWNEPGHPYDPYVGVGLGRMNRSLLQAAPIENLQGILLDNVDGSTLSMLPVGVLVGSDYFNSIGDGHYDGMMVDDLLHAEDGWDKAQAGIVLGGKAIAEGIRGVALVNNVNHLPEEDGAQKQAIVGLYAGHLALYGAGMAGYLFSDRSRARADLRTFELYKDGHLASGAIPRRNGSVLAWNLNPELTPTQVGLQVTFRNVSLKDKK